MADSHSMAGPAAAKELLAAGGLVVVLASGAAWLGEADWRLPVAAVVVFASGVFFLWRGLTEPGRSIGWANRVTLVRAILVAVLAGALMEPDLYRDPAWIVVGLAGLALLLDGVDGWLARRLEICSEFGARFDMEVDAALILVLCIGLLAAGRAGPWVLAIGLMRPAFVLATRRWQWLGQPLPASLRRQAVCVTQMVALLIALLPFTTAWIRFFVLASALALLTVSFAIDIAWLWRRRR